MTEPAEPAQGPGLATAPPGSPADLAERVERDVASLETELAEIDLLIQQATAESERHESKRAAMAARIAAVRAGDRVDPVEQAEQTAQLVNLTKRATVMESQVDVLKGKVKVLHRHHDALAALASDLRQLPDGGSVPLLSAAGSGADDSSDDGDGSGTSNEMARVSPAVSRMILAAQEDLRRDIARAMHDGPAQSLTNIVLQAQIVERLIASDPAAAKPETRELIAMVQSTSTPRSRSSSTSGRWSSTTSGWCRPCAGRPGTADGGPGSPSTSTRWVAIGVCRWSSSRGCSG